MILGNFTITLPQAGQVQWDGPLNTALQTIADCLDQLIGTDSLDIQAALDLQGNYLLNVRGIMFSEQSDPGSPLGVWWDTDGELYVRDGAGNKVKITSGGAINVAGTGGIGGEYVSAGALVTYSSSNTRYTFLTNVSGGSAASIDAGTVRVRNGTNSNAVSMASPVGLGGDVALTLPNALPASTLPLQVDATGTMLFSNVLQSPVLSGSLAFSPRARIIDPAGGTVASSAVVSSYAFSGSQPGWFLGGNGAVDYPVPFDRGDRLVAVNLSINSTTNQALTASLRSRNFGTGVSTTVASRPHISPSGSYYVLRLGDGSTTGTMPNQLSSSGSYYIRLELASWAGSPQLYLYGISASFDRPPGS